MHIDLKDGVEQIFSTQSPATSEAYNIATVKGVSVQGTVTGTGAVATTLVIEVSNDGTWMPVGTITLSGTAAATDGFTVDARWALIRAKCTAISGTGATATVTIGA